MQYTGVLLISATTTLKAIAVKAGHPASAVMTASFIYAPPARVQNAWYQDKDGDGRIESAVLIFPSDLDTLPERLGFAIREERHGTTFEHLPGPAGIAFAPGSGTRVEVTLSDPFPFGITSIPNADSSGRIYGRPGSPFMDGVFRVSDSVPPVVIGAAYLAESDSTPFAGVKVTLSEAVTTPAEPTPADLNGMFQFKSEGRIVEDGRIKILSAVKPGEAECLIRFDSASDYFPMAGDSVALNPDGAISDLFANAPAKAVFFALTGGYPTGIAAVTPRGFKGDSDWVRDGRTLRGRSLSRHPPRSIACYNVDGGLLGMARPKGSSGTWELPAGNQAMVLILEMPNGARRGISIRP